MKKAPWIIQILLALLFLFSGGMKLVLPIEEMKGAVELPGVFLRLSVSRKSSEPSGFVFGPNSRRWRQSGC